MQRQHRSAHSPLDALRAPLHRDQRDPRPHQQPLELIASQAIRAQEVGRTSVPPPRPDFPPTGGLPHGIAIGATIARIASAAKYPRHTTATGRLTSLRHKPGESLAPSPGRADHTRRDRRRRAHDERTRGSSSVYAISVTRFTTTMTIVKTTVTPSTTGTSCIEAPVTTSDPSPGKAKMRLDKTIHKRETPTILDSFTSRQASFI